MPHLSIIPAAAVMDGELTDGQVRVLCAIGTFTNKLGGNCWASVRTLAKQCNLTERSVQRALPALVERGYLRRVERAGQTNLYEVVLQGGVTAVSEGGDTGVGGGVTLESPKRPRLNEKNNDRRTIAQTVLGRIWSIFPKRDVPHLYPPALRAVEQVLAQGVDPVRLEAAAVLYAEACIKDRTEPKYVKTIAKFYSDGAWEHYRPVARVYGRTREEWIRSGQDVAEFDKLAAQRELSA